MSKTIKILVDAVVSESGEYCGEHLCAQNFWDGACQACKVNNERMTGDKEDPYRSPLKRTKVCHEAERKANETQGTD